MGANGWWRRVSPGRAVVLDAVAALLVFGMLLAAAAMVARPSRHVLPTLDSLHPAAVALAAASCGTLLLRRHRPWAALALALVCGVLYALAGYNMNPVLMLPSAVALYTVAVRTDRRTAWGTAAGSAAVLAGAEIALGPGNWLEPQNFSVLAWAAAAAAVGDAVRSRRAYIAAIEERAERAERTREEEAARQVAEDRIRIARELHDVVAHHIALINAQAGVAIHLAGEIPAPVLGALEHIRDASHEALQELKATVGLLRASDESGVPLEPAPGIAQLPELLASFARAGLTVSLELQGEVRPLPPAVDLTAFRIVQESLTNVSKHAGVPTARVQLFFGPEQLAIRVEDDGRTAPMRSSYQSQGQGHGLTGMGERAAVVGGTLTAGRDPWGGFRVAADLPLRPGARGAET